MDKDLVKEFQSKYNEYLLDIYSNKRGEYREEALHIIEHILTDRRVTFNRPATAPSVETNKPGFLKR
jgi:hypothetical protein